MTAPQRCAEIEIRGHITFSPPDPEARAFLAAAAEADRRPDYGVIRAEEVAAQLDALAAQGVRVVLIRYASAGGANGAARILCSALARFRASGGKIVSYVETAGSTAVDPALEGDVVLMAPGGKFMVHASLRREGADPRETAEHREIILRRSLERIAARTATPRDMLREWLSVCEDEQGVNVVELTFRDALNFGWADYSVTLEKAREVAELVADGHTVASPRAELLAMRAHGKDMAQELFGQALATCSQPGRRAYPRKRRVERHVAPDPVASADCAIHNVGNGAVAERHVGSGAITADKIAAGSITTGHISAVGISADSIKAGTLSADRVQTGSITVEKMGGWLNSSQVARCHIDLFNGTLTLHDAYNVTGAYIEASSYFPGNNWVRVQFPGSYFTSGAPLIPILTVQDLNTGWHTYMPTPRVSEVNSNYLLFHLFDGVNGNVLNPGGTLHTAVYVAVMKFG